MSYQFTLFFTLSEYLLPLVIVMLFSKYMSNVRKVTNMSNESYMDDLDITGHRICLIYSIF